MTLHIIIAMAAFALAMAFFGILGYKAAFAIADHARNRRRCRGRADAVAILAERYARGDIDAEEYSRRRAVLEA
jgi:uncharacterized membrane protein